MEIRVSCDVTGLSHRYQNYYLFRNLNFSLETGSVLVVKGANGAGKSTLIKILTGGMEAISGKVSFRLNESEIPHDNLWKMMAMVAPYQELPEELTLRELIDFQIKIDSKSLKWQDFLEVAEPLKMTSHLDKLISDYSTGMKQKAKVISALGLKRPILFLDEPTSNLDLASQQWLLHHLQSMKHDHLILMASNEPEEIKLGDVFVELA